MKHAGISTLFSLGLAVMLLLTVTAAPVMAADENPGASDQFEIISSGAVIGMLVFDIVIVVMIIIGFLAVP